jgi:transglutaminase-like putative cysteine protease
MNSRSSYRRLRRMLRIRTWSRQSFLLLALLSAIAFTHPAVAGDAPAWMQVQVNLPLPEHDDKTDAILLYSENILSVQPDGKIKTLERRVYKILRPGGKDFGTVRVFFDSQTRVNFIHAWCIPAQGRGYEVKDKDAVETALVDVENGELMTDLHVKLLQIPASEPGNIVGYEIEHDDRPYVLQDIWQLQEPVPVRETHYTLQLPAGWEYKAAWINHPEVAPTGAGGGWQWVATDLKAIKPEEEMPPWKGIAGQMIVTLIPPSGSQQKGLLNWSEMGSWYLDLVHGRRDASAEIKQKVATLAPSSLTPLAKMRALARFAQNDIRYVAIELGIGGQQPHPAADVFTNRYGDCKDKATLLSSMLKEIGVESYYVVINADRGSITANTPPNLGFNHVILAIQLPAGVSDPSLVAVMQHPKLGRLLFFDPTNEMTPFGRLSGQLQANYGMLVTPDGGELVELPQLPSTLNGITRTAKLVLDGNGSLRGDVHEVRLGDQANYQRHELRAATKDVDQIKPIENVLAHSFATYNITKASIVNLHQTDLPFEYNYSIQSDNYAKLTGNLLLVRPRVLGTKSSALLETKERRQYPVEFNGPERDSDIFEITVPDGYEPDDLPLPIDADYAFASYHSKAEMVGHILRYTRSFEIKELSVPVNQSDDLKKLYRVIASDERNTAVFKPIAH